MPLLRLRQCLGYRTWIDPDVRVRRTESEATHYPLPVGNPLRSGWYMLEVEHTQASIGADLWLQSNQLAQAGQPESVDGGERAHPAGSLDEAAPLPERSAGVSFSPHLLLTAKPISKRVLYLPHRAHTLMASVSIGNAPLKRVSLVPLTAGFARRRMARKLEFLGMPGGAGESQAALYARYQRVLQRHVEPIDYQWQPQADSLGGSKAADQSMPVLDDSSQSAPVVTRGIIDEQESWLTAPASLRNREFCLLIGSRTVLLPQALSTMVSAMQGDSVLCYADNDQVSVDGTRHSPAHKPAWNPEYLFNVNYLGECLLCRTDWLVAEGLLTDRHLASFPEICLTAAERLSDAEVVRVPDVLWSCREVDTESVIGTARHHSPSWQSAVNDHFSTRNVEVVAGELCGSARVQWPLPCRPPSVDIIIPTRDRLDVLRPCIESLLRCTDYADFRITVVDNDSSDVATLAYLREMRDKRVRVLRYQGDFNYSAINNHAVSRSECDVVVLLNNDTEAVRRDWLLELIRHTSRSEIGCVGAKLLYSNGRIQHAGVIVGLLGVAGHAHRFSSGDADGYCGRLKVSQNVSAVTAACLAVRRDVYEQVGGLDAEHLAVTHNDVDFCLRVQQAGYRNLWTPHACLYHHESLSRGADDTQAKRARAEREFRYMQHQWQTSQFDDPAYNPNLTRDHEDFGLPLAAA